MLLSQGGPDQGAQLLGVSRHHQLSSLAVQDPGQSDAGLGLGGLAGLVDEDVSEVTLRREELSVMLRPRILIYYLREHSTGQLPGSDEGGHDDPVLGQLRHGWHEVAGRAGVVVRPHGVRDEIVRPGESVEPKDLVSWSLRRARTKITYNSSV